MKLHSIEEIESMFRAMGLSTDADRLLIRRCDSGDRLEAKAGMVGKERLLVRCLWGCFFPDDPVSFFVDDFPRADGNDVDRLLLGGSINNPEGADPITPQPRQLVFQTLAGAGVVQYLPQCVTCFLLQRGMHAADECSHGIRHLEAVEGLFQEGLCFEQVFERVKLVPLPFQRGDALLNLLHEVSI